MSVRRPLLLTVLAWLFLILLAIPTVLLTAQPDDETCPAIVNTALQAVGDSCGFLNPDEACYGHVDIDATFWDPNANLVFEAPADRVDLPSLRTVVTSPLDEETGAWGVAVMNLQANLPEVAPGQSVTFLMMGDVELENRITPEQAGQFGQRAPASVQGDGTLYRCPTREGVTVDELPAGSELDLIGRDEAGEWYEVLLPSGRQAWIPTAEVAADAGAAALPVTYGMDIPPRCGAMQAFYFTMGLGVPECQEAPNAMVVQTPRGVEVAFNVNGLDITTGSSVALVMAEMPSRTGEGTERVLVATLLEGELTAEFEQPQSARGPLGDPNALDCTCVTVVQAARPGTAFAIALNDDGTVDLNSRLVEFTGDPELLRMLVQNACRNANEAGAFARTMACDFDISLHIPCTATAANADVNQRPAPSTGAPAQGVLPYGAAAEVRGWAIGADGLEWWQLVGEQVLCSWVRGDVVNLSGACENIPHVDVNPANVPPPAPQQGPLNVPPEGRVETWDVFDCKHVGGNVFEWYKAEVVFVGDVVQDFRITDGPFSGGWQPGCPPGLFCGDGACTKMGEYIETQDNCPQDCAPPAPARPATGPAVCGDGYCDGVAEASSCSADCGCDYDGVCEFFRGESYPFCSDCDILFCNFNGICEGPSETSSGCSDCSTSCNYNGVCEPAAESPYDCPDCYTCNNDGVCQLQHGESPAGCPADCGL
ncbi:MAG: hypothetical protein JXB47_17080 [Anaerolineae bacterium]|nr:hypothetical protein [Anaerolineae bacterium]